MYDVDRGEYPDFRYWRWPSGWSLCHANAFDYALLSSICGEQLKLNLWEIVLIAVSLVLAAGGSGRKAVLLRVRLAGGDDGSTPVGVNISGEQHY